VVVLAGRIYDNVRFEVGEHRQDEIVEDMV
jgi:hypothetical protein